jgi:multidrug efflux pump subunit AcrB
MVALVFNPVLCARFMKLPAERRGRRRPGDRLMAFGISSYEPSLRWALRHRFRTLGGAVLVLIVLLVVFAELNAGVELFPDTEPQYASLRIEAPSGTRIELSNAYAREAETKIAELADLKAYVTQVGAGEDVFGGSAQAPPHLSLVSMEFVPLEERSRSSRDQLEELRRRMAGFTGAAITIEKQEDGPPTGKPVNIEISGKDFAILGSIADRIEERIRGVPGLVNLTDDYDRGRPEIQIRPDLEKAARYGLRRMDIASTVLTAIRGEKVTQYRIGEDEYDIVVRFAPEARRSVQDLTDLTVFYEGQSIPLGAFAEVSYESGLGAIRRLDSRRVVSVTADVAAGYNGNAVLAEVRKTLADFPVPPGYRLDYTGESEDQEEAEAFLGQAFQIALFLIFLVLVTEFSSVTVPFVIMTSVILSLIGVFLGLLVTRTPFGIIMTGVGVISLAGVVVNNAIVLLDYTIRLRQSGMEKMEAIIAAGRTRFRPVILTAVTPILGLLPLTTGFSIDFDRLFHGDLGRAVVLGGESSQWWGPMGVAVIWGLAVATFLTLIVVPVTYSSIDGAKAAARRLVSWPASIRRRPASESQRM